MSLLTLVAVSSFACASPTHHDGDAIRCAGGGKSMRLYGIDAPEMPGACRPGRECTPGDPYAARDYLKGLTRGRSVTCEERDVDDYGRRVVRCTADGEDISCAMVASGHAVERYGSLGCGRNGARLAYADPDPGTPALSPPVTTQMPYTPAREPQPNAEPGGFAPVPTALPWVIGLAWLTFINILAYWAFAVDKDRSVASVHRPVRRIPESTLLTLAALGGSAGAITAQQTLRHKTKKQPFASRLLLITGVQIGIVLGAVVLLL